MAFSVDDYQDLMEVLRQHPEWTAQLRELLVGRQLDEANERLTRIEAALDQQSKQIAEQSRQISEQGRQIGLMADRLAEAIKALTEAIDRLSTRVGTVEGWKTEQQWMDNGRSLLHRVVRKAKRVEVPDLDGLAAATTDGRISEAEMDNVARADVLYQGLSDSGSDIIAVIEASKTIDIHDIDRADVRARILQRAGYNAVGVVGGATIRPEDKVRAENQGVAIFLGGQLDFWPPAAA